MKTGLFVGRFQPFHKGHLRKVEDILKKVDHLVIVIGSAEKSHILNNPFTAGERYWMIRETLKDKYVSIVPVRDVNRYSIWADHIISMVPPFDIVFDHDYTVMNLFSAKGYETKMLTYTCGDNYMSGTEIREAMIYSNNQWRRCVPVQTLQVIDLIKGDERLKKMINI